MEGILAGLPVLYMREGQGWFQIFPIWHSAQELIEYARECCIIRDLTPEERERFGLPER